MRIDYYHFDELSSTNSFVKENLPLFSQENLSIITADRQTRGRGRRERSWLSQEGNLFMTCLFKTADTVPYAMRLALACCHLLKEFKPQIKWPNDILIGGKKIAGILGERVDGWMILGIGVNLNAHIPLPGATSLSQLGRKVDVREFAKDLAETFDQQIDLQLLNDYSSHAQGDRLVMRTELETVQGIFLGFGERGEIRLEVEGRERRFFSGDIV